MGTQSSNPSTTSPTTTQQPTTTKIQLLHDQIDKFYTTELTKLQFTTQLFTEIEKLPHPTAPPGTTLLISRTFLLERLFVHLSQSSRGRAVGCRELKELVEGVYRSTERAIQVSFQVMDVDRDGFISGAQFLSFMDNCYLSLIVGLQRDLPDQHIKLCLKQWIAKNKKNFYDQILKIFHGNKRSDPEKWFYNDYKRWVLSGEYWTMDLQLGVRRYRVPVNLLALFGIGRPGGQ